MDEPAGRYDDENINESISGTEDQEDDDRLRKISM
jgi:hypothetical protein